MKRQAVVTLPILFIILFLGSSTTQAKELVIDVTRCVAGTCDPLSDAEDFRTMSCKSRGIGWSNNDYKPLETFAVFGRTLLGIQEEKKWDFNSFVKWVDSDGDHIVFRDKKIYGGTGKWKRVTGEVQWKRLRNAKSLPTGNFANCGVITGTLELPE